MTEQVAVREKLGDSRVEEIEMKRRVTSSDLKCYCVPYATKRRNKAVCSKLSLIYHITLSKPMSGACFSVAVNEAIDVALQPFESHSLELHKHTHKIRARHKHF